MKGSTTMERCAASAGAAAFDATGAGAVIASGGVRFAPRRYQALPAANIANPAIPSASSASRERLFGPARFATGGAADFQRIDADRLGDVLELRRAEIGDREIEPPFHLAIGVLGETDRARLGDALQPRGDIDAVAHQIAVGLLDHVADMNADAELDAALGRQAGVALDEAVLHLDRAAHSVDHAAELDENAVAGALDDAPVMSGDGRVDQIAAQPAEARQGAVLVRAGEPAVADHVGDQDRRDLPGFGHGAPSRVMQNSTNAGGRRRTNGENHGDLHCGCPLDAQDRRGFSQGPFQPRPHGELRRRDRRPGVRLAACRGKVGCRGGGRSGGNAGRRPLQLSHAVLPACGAIGGLHVAAYRDHAEGTMAEIAPGGRPSRRLCCTRRSNGQARPRTIRSWRRCTMKRTTCASSPIR